MTKKRKRNKGSFDLTQSASDSSTGQIQHQSNSKQSAKSRSEKTATSTPKEKLAKFAFETDRGSDKMAESERTETDLTDCTLSPVGRVDQPSNSDLMAKMCAFGEDIAKLTSTVEELKGALFSVREENDELKRAMSEAKRREEALRDQLLEARHLAETADHRVEELSAYVRRNNLRIYGLPETDGGKTTGGTASKPETSQQCEDKVVKMLNDKLKVVVNRKDIEACHRVGVKHKDSQTGQRGVIVRFLSRKVRDAVLLARRNLKGTRTVIVEDLTPRAYSLLQQVKDDKDVCVQAWSKNGAVIMKTHSGKIETVRSLAFLKDDTKRPGWKASSSASARNVSPANGQ